MQIFINAQPFELEAPYNVTGALSLFLTTAQLRTSFAVALNGDFIAKENYPTTDLSNQDVLDVLFPIQGG